MPVTKLKIETSLRKLVRVMSEVKAGVLWDKCSR
jgi:hypothetical protein